MPISSARAAPPTSSVSSSKARWRNPNGTTSRSTRTTASRAYVSWAIRGSSTTRRRASRAFRRCARGCRNGPMTTRAPTRRPAPAGSRCRCFRSSIPPTTPAPPPMPTRSTTASPRLTRNGTRSKAPTTIISASPTRWKNPSRCRATGCDARGSDMEASLNAELIANFVMEPTPLLQFGKTPRGKRGIGFVKSGTFEGPAMRGEVLGGSDHLLVLTDGAAIPDVRLALRTNDGALIQMEYKGVLRAPRAVMAKFAEPETLDPKEYYFCVAVFFETADERYAFLNQAVCVGYGYPLRLNGNNGVRYEVFKILSASARRH